MSKRSLQLYFTDMLTAISDIEEFTKDMSFDQFSKDKKTKQAVVRCMEIIGEAANAIPQEVKDTNPDIQWREIISMRNKVLHEYFGIDDEVIWQTISEDLIPLKEKILSLQKKTD